MKTFYALRSLSFSASFLFLITVVLSLSGYSQTFTQEAQGFNVFVQGDFVFGGGDVEGAVAVGNNLTIQGNNGQFAIQTPGTFTVAGMAAPAGLLVGNDVNLNGGGLGILSGGKILIGSNAQTKALSVDMNGATVNTRVVNIAGNYNSTPNISLSHSQSENVYQTSPIDFSTAFNVFRVRSTNVAALATNMTITNANGIAQNPSSISNNSQIYVKALSAGANILNLTGNNLNKISSMTFDVKPSASQYVVINVDKPGTFNWSNFNFTGVSSTEAQYILINFSNSTTVNINNSSTVFATIFAPNADVDKKNSANLDGQVIAKSFTMLQGGEVHRMYFLSDDPSGTAFPVEWADFSAEKHDSEVSLFWATASEQNAHSFSIERSVDLVMLDQLGSVASAGNTSEMNFYQYSDRNIASLRGKTVYYRLKQIDFNGQFSYSPTVAVTLDADQLTQLSAYPNPVSSTLTINWQSAEMPKAISLLNAMGQIMARETVNQLEGQIAFPVDQLSPGIYSVLIETSHSLRSKTVIVK